MVRTLAFFCPEDPEYNFLEMYNKRLEKGVDFTDDEAKAMHAQYLDMRPTPVRYI